MYRVHPVRWGVMAALFALAAGTALRAQAPDERPQSPRGFLGVAIGPAEGDKGVLVRDVAPDSPASKAGLKKGDQITKLDGKDVSNPEAFFKAVAAKKPGDQLKIVVMRDDKEQDVTATVGERPNRFTAPDNGQAQPTQPQDQNRRVRELEKRVEELEKRVRELEKK